MEFFGDTIDSLRTFDLETQRSLGEIKQAVALPVRGLIATDEGIARLEKRLKVTTDEHGSDEEGSKNDIVGQIKQGTLPPGSEFLAPFFYDMEDLFRYLPDQTLCALIEPDDINKQADEWFEKIEQGRREEAEEGKTLPETAELYHDHGGIMAVLAKFPIVTLRLLGADTQGPRMDTKSAAWLGVRLRPSHSLGHGQAAQENAQGTVGGVGRRSERLVRLREAQLHPRVPGAPVAGD